MDIRREDGLALIVVLMALLLLTALSVALTLATSLESTIAGNFRENQEAFYAKYRELTGLNEEVVNPATVAYFTVLSSGPVFFNILRMTSRLSLGENMGMSVAYMTNAMPYMHSAWIASMRVAGHWNPEGTR